MSSAENTATEGAVISPPPPTIAPTYLFIDSKWATQYKALLLYKADKGSCQVSPDDEPKYPTLAKWIVQQHRDYTAYCDVLEGRTRIVDFNKKLDNDRTAFHEEKLKLLRRAGFIFQRVLDKRTAEKQARFDANCNALKEFRSKYGTPQIPSGRKTLENLMGSDAFEPTKNQKTEDSHKHQEKFIGEMEVNKYYRPLVAMENKDGESDEIKQKKIIKKESEEFLKYHRLGSWLSSIRNRLRNQAAKQRVSDLDYDDSLTPEMLNRLDDIGVDLPSVYTCRGKRNADDNENQKHVETALAAVATPTPKRPKVMSRKTEEHWEKSLFEMKEFVRKFGHCTVPVTKEYTSLRCWLDAQRREYKKIQAGQESHILTAQRMCRLADIGFSFTAEKQRRTFDESFQQWLDYRAKNNGKNPRRHGEDGLGKWMSMIRRKKKDLDAGGKTNLTQEQIDKLSAAGFPWVVVKPPAGPRKTWDERYLELIEFQMEHGHTRVPQLSPGLGHWVHKQRNLYSEIQRGIRSSNNYLSDEQISKLDDIDFEWNVRAVGDATKASQLAATEELMMEKEEDDSVSDSEVDYEQYQN